MGVTGVGSGQPDVVGSRQLLGDLCPRVAGSDHKDTSFLELTGVAVLGDMKLDNARIELAGELRDPGFCQLDIATTTLSASNRRFPAVATKRSPSRDSLSTLTPVSTRISKRRA